jgi:hypothetical protein
MRQCQQREIDFLGFFQFDRCILFLMGLKGAKIRRVDPSGRMALGARFKVL